MVCGSSFVCRWRELWRGAGSDNSQKLWYRQPAVKWEEALPIGNGRLGAMVFGGVQEERLQINEDTIWAGEKRDRNNPNGAALSSKCANYCSRER